MEDLIINKGRNGNEVYPYIKLNAKSGVCMISGSSYMQDSRKFFEPVISWVKEYTEKNFGGLTMIYNLQSLNTGTSRILFEILEILKNYKLKGGNVYIKWYFEDKQDTHIDDIIDITSGFGIEVDILSA